MPIKLPELDNRSYADLVKEAVASIPDLYPDWTDHNPSNPGIALIELLAWLTEMTLYRTNQIPERNYEVFLKLLNGPAYARPAGQDLETAIRETMKALRERHRAVSADDYDHLVTYVFPASPEAKTPGVASIQRIHCLPEHKIAGQVKVPGARGYITLLVVPAPSDPNAPWIGPDQPLSKALQDFFKDRRILTTHLHVGSPDYLDVRLDATLYLKDDAKHLIVQADAVSALFGHFHPVSGGAAQKGWPFGRAVHVSDIYAILDQVRGIDFVEDVTIATTQPGRAITEGSEVTALTLNAWELVKLPKSDIHLTLKERRGDQWVTISS